MDADTQPVDFGTKKPTDLGRYGEELTRQDLADRGYTIVSEQAQIQLPNGKYFKPDFIAYDPTTNSVILVESKMGRVRSSLPTSSSVTSTTARERTISSVVA